MKDDTWKNIAAGVACERRTLAIRAVEWLRAGLTWFTIPAYMGVAANYKFTSLHYWGVLLIVPACLLSYAVEAVIRDRTVVGRVFRALLSGVGELLSEFGPQIFLGAVFGFPFGLLTLVLSYIPEKVLHVVGNGFGLVAFAFASIVSLAVIYLGGRQKIAELAEKGRKTRARRADGSVIRGN
jgi:hypothetical protein